MITQDITTLKQVTFKENAHCSPSNGQSCYGGQWGWLGVHDLLLVSGHVVVQTSRIIPLALGQDYTITPCWTVQPSGRPQDYDVGWERIDLFQPSRLAFPSVFTTHIHSMRGIGTPHRKADLEVVFVGNADGYHLQLLPMTEVNVVLTEYNIWEAELTRDNTHTYFKWIAEVNRIHSVWCRPL